jgi:alcohol dehydrogenase (cytochrome c)
VWKFEIGQMALPPGLLATEGNIVVCATSEGYLIALDALTGKLLWKYNAGGAFTSSPMSYALEGRQYIAISGPNSVLSFALPR